MQQTHARGEAGGPESRAGARTIWTLAIVALTGAVLATAGCTKTVSATVDGEELVFNEREQEALVRCDRCNESAQGTDEAARCAVVAMDESHVDIGNESNRWLEKSSRYWRGRAAGLLGMVEVRDADLRRSMLEICNRLYESERAWCASRYSEAR